MTSYAKADKQVLTPRLQYPVNTIYKAPALLQRNAVETPPIKNQCKRIVGIRESCCIGYRELAENAYPSRLVSGTPDRSF